MRAATCTLLIWVSISFAQWTEPVPFINQPEPYMKCPWISGDGLRLYGSTSSSLYWVPIQMGAQPLWRVLPAHLNATPTQRSPSESPNGDTLYFISAPREDAEGYGDLDVYFSVRTDTGWGEVYNAGPNVNSPDREWSVSISRDGTLLVVASYGHAGYGSHDLYYHEKQTDGTWGEAINFGPNVNHTLDDENGSLSPNNDRLFYFYNGPNYGDILESRKVNGIWQPATPLPSPVNSVTETEMDPCIASDGRTLWYRKGVTYPISFQFYTTVDTSVLDAVESAPNRVQSFQVVAYPNPFNNANTITLSIPSYARDVEISIINTLGQIVNRETVRAAGGMAYYVNDMSGFASGVYFVRAQAGEYAAAKKIILLK